MPLVVESFAPGGRDAQTVEVSRVIVKDDHGNPLVVAVEFGDGKYHVSHLLDPDFEHLVATFGYRPPDVNKTVSVKDQR